MNKNFDIIRTIGAITRTIQMDSNQRFRELGLNNNLYIYIIRVCEEPGMFLGQLADTIQIERTTSFRSVKKLIKLGFFELSSDATNQKIKRIFPTKKALDMYPQLHAYELKHSNYLLSDLSIEEEKQLALLLSRLKY
ncbi:MarR family winged helix-turn-helix transcriptional regulator [Streptococcus orisratti]|uniref:MarR family winged helix-turn-helix transcriptional regulator n=1 Tax=Streptococcus orisratti TaxID=114652 RepID=UPI002A90DA71|nr:MarR family winged helix-turn-helix transcriptional regulator [Streptococcus orisratti]MDY5635896.1 MarR family winged helix-turn-helix transcriptional regulator [Streptococcus orisratti]